MPGSLNSYSQLIHQFYVGSTWWQLSLLEFGYSHVVFIQRRRLLWFWFWFWWWLRLIFNATLVQKLLFKPVLDCVTFWISLVVLSWKRTTLLLSLYCSIIEVNIFVGLWAEHGDSIISERGDEISQVAVEFQVGWWAIFTKISSFMDINVIAVD